MKGSALSKVVVGSFVRKVRWEKSIVWEVRGRNELEVEILVITNSGGSKGSEEDKVQHASVILLSSVLESYICFLFLYLER